MACKVIFITWLLAAFSLAACGGDSARGTADGGADGPGLTLTTEASRIRVITGSFTEIEVSVTREGGLEGEVELSMSGLPALVTSASVRVPAGDTSAVVVVNAGQSAEHGGPVPVTLIARAVDADDLSAELQLPAYVAGLSGSADQSFSFDGEVIYKLSALEFENASDAALDGEGRLLVGGRVAEDTTTLGFLCRLLPDGSLDPDFADGGVRIGDPDVSPSPVDSLIAAPGGEAIYLVRSTDGRFARKALDSGDLDGTFAGNGAFQFGSFGPREFARMNGGFLAFNDSAVRTFDYQGNERAGFQSADLGFKVILSAAEDTDGRILLGLKGSNGANVLDVVRLGPSGALDLTFGEDGYALLPLQGPDETGRVPRIALGDQGGGVALGLAEPGIPNSFIYEVSVARFSAGGDPVAGFGSAGRRVVEPSAVLGDVILEPGGKVLVLALTTEDDNRIWRYQADGQPDASWGEGGVITIAPPREYRRLVHDREAGRVILVGKHVGEGAITATRLWL